jgi:hypothetical protein
MSTVRIFLSGMATMGFIVAAMFFLRYWHRAQERLFLFFGAAFFLLAINQALITLSSVSNEEMGWAFLFRVVAFGGLIVGIVVKNIDRRARQTR